MQVKSKCRNSVTTKKPPSVSSWPGKTNTRSSARSWRPRTTKWLVTKSFFCSVLRYTSLSRIPFHASFNLLFYDFSHLPFHFSSFSKTYLYQHNNENSSTPNKIELRVKAWLTSSAPISPYCYKSLSFKLCILIKKKIT